MRAFAFLSLAAAALAAPAGLPVPVGSLATVVAPANTVVNGVVGAVAKVGADASASIANVGVDYNTIGNNDVNGNNVNVLRSIDVNKAGNVILPVKVNAQNPDVNVASPHNNRAVADVAAPLYTVINALIGLCSQNNIDVAAALANAKVDYNQIANGVANNNNVQVAKRGAVDALVAPTTAIFALVNALLKVGVDASLIIGNIQVTCNQILNNVGNGNNVHVLSRGLVNVLAPITTVVNAVVPLLVKICAELSLDILNIALQNNSIGNDVLNYNTINVLSH